MEQGKTEMLFHLLLMEVLSQKIQLMNLFPKALHELPSEQEILGANINEMGRNAASVKIVARMFNLHFDVLWQRHEREQKIRRRLVVGLSLLAVVLTLIIAGVIFYQNRMMQIN